MSYHYAIYESVIEYFNGELVFCVYARPKSNKIYELNNFCVYRETESGNKTFRNLNLSMAGYCVNFDELEPWYEFELKSSGPYSFSYISFHEENLIFDKYPKFKYVYDYIKNKSFDLKFIFSILQFWIKHPECEYVFKSGFDKVALDKRFYKITDKKRSETFTMMKKIKSIKGLSSELNFNQLMYLVKNPKTDLYVYSQFIQDINSYYFDFESKKYTTFLYYSYYFKIKDDFASFGEFTGYYRDYVVMCNDLNKNLSDKFWKFPKYFRIAHNKVMKEHNIYKKNLEKNKQRIDKEKYENVCGKFFELKENINGYDIFVPQYDDWNKQAEVLHQCIITAQYRQKVIDKNCLLIFVRKNNIPIATCEVQKNFKIMQFYADELDRKNCLPTDDVKLAMNIWLDKVSKKIKRIG